MPTLLQINVTSNAGSTGKIAEQIGIIAQKNGWSCYHAFGRDAHYSKIKSIKVGNTFNVLRHYAEHKLLDNEGLASRRATRKLVKKIHEINPDIVHIHNIHDHWLNYPILFEYLNASKVPIVWTFHDCWSFTGHCAHFVQPNCHKWKSQCYECPISNSLIDKSFRNFNLKKRIFGNSTKLNIVTVSTWLKKIVLQSFLSDKNIRVINNGIDLNIFKPIPAEGLKKRYGLDDKFIVLGVATSWSENKGLYDYIELSKILPADCKIVLVGLKPSQINKLPSNIVKLPLTKNQQQLAELYSIADVVLSLSRAETFGLTIAEGFACGTPGIVYNNTAQPELITPETGFIVENGNIKGIADTINIIKQNSKRFYFDACIQCVSNLYNKEDRFTDYINLYEEILNK